MIRKFEVSRGEWAHSLIVNMTGCRFDYHSRKIFNLKAGYSNICLPLSSNIYANFTKRISMHLLKKG